ncbi:hypothetical protein PAN31117_01812 [Pandoraea anapnoica]|uniref:DUF3455 domain-containing protein n=1 Tax=Pandoraea anapnoica TaxID=2508301 RepID=A0A5E4ZW80_9BURK|nr:DUF3455 domain-containing protein [Pandoraea anapnoica]VVE65266.1 hypothetical protein PAN31117_01812 [Pandoraea anapnoica]
MNRIVLVSLVATTVLSACAGSMSTPGSSLPVADAVKVPDGHSIALQTVGKGEILYECREKKDAMGQFEWSFVGPDAILSDRSGNVVGKYYGPPATWESSDGSKVTATQVAVSPAGTGNIPLQLVKANPATGSGAMQGVTYIQRLTTQGGTAPMSQCNMATKGAKQTVKYQADYIFWKAS